MPGFRRSGHKFYFKGFQTYSFHQVGYEAVSSFAVLGGVISGVMKALCMWLGYSLLRSLRRLRRIAD